MTSDRDAMLVAACLRGDRSAFDELVNRYQHVLYHAAYSITGSVDDAMDVTQSAFLNAYEKLHTFDPAGRFFSWLYRIAVNQALNLVRRRRPAVDLDECLPGTERDPEQAADEAEVNRRLHHALMALEPEQRALVTLKHLEGLSYREIGALLEVSEQTVKSRLFSARRRLRSILAAEGVTP